MRQFLLLFGCCLTLNVWAQNKVSVQGTVLDTAGNVLPYSTVALLYPTDSTLAYFGITNSEGAFKIDQVAPENYLIQASYLGFANYFSNINSEALKQDLFLAPIQLQMKAVNLDGVEVTGTQAPILIKSDTIVYNASSFRTKPTDNVEQLLKKMPGMEVDRDGTVKAQGEEVKKVLVDGKEFFGNDPKMATRNLPASSVKKVEVFDKKSDVAEFTGVDDGQRTKTINLEMKEDQKQGLFGDVKAGYGTNDRYELGASVYKYSEKTQVSGLAMLNNINEFGFSISDYLNFQGGLLNSGGNVNFRIDGNSGTPLNVGQPQNGNLRSGALGLNLNHEFSEGKDFNVNYMLSGSNRFTTSATNSVQYTPDAAFNISEDSKDIDKNLTHTVSTRWKNEVDSLNRFILTARGNLTDANSFSQSFRNSNRDGGGIFNALDRNLNSDSRGFRTEATATWVRKSANKVGRNWYASTTLSLSESIPQTNWLNTTQIGMGNQVVTQTTEDFFRRDTEGSRQLQLKYNWNEPIFKQHYLDLGVELNGTQEYYNRKEELLRDESEVSRPKEFSVQNIASYVADIGWKWNNDKTSFSLGSGFQSLAIDRSYDVADTSEITDKLDLLYLNPYLRIRHEFARGKRLNFSYNAKPTNPAINRVAPLRDLTNPLAVNLGNLSLEPEFTHTGNLFFMIYDAFSFTSVFANINSTYTENAIVQQKQIDSQTLVQESQPVNFGDRSSLGGSLGFSTPIKPLGISFDTDIESQLTDGNSIINGQTNGVNSVMYGMSASIGNRKKEVVDAEIGYNWEQTDTKYSLQSRLNNRYTKQGVFADLSLYFGDKWVISSSFDYSRYSNSQVNNSVSVPLWNAELTRNFLENNRGSLTLQVFDILNRNTGVEQFASENYIGQQVSNVLNQYFMLTFNYKLKA
ncbi:MAG: outer membrane beta-barrel protein, partial [Luteibaculum sp.]